MTGLLMNECVKIVEETKYSKKVCPMVTLFTRNPITPDLRSNKDFQGGKPVTDSLSYGTAEHDFFLNISI
jgi:hypothetical protein